MKLVNETEENRATMDCAKVFKCYEKIDLVKKIAGKEVKWAVPRKPNVMNRMNCG